MKIGLKCLAFQESPWHVHHLAFNLILSYHWQAISQTFDPVFTKVHQAWTVSQKRPFEPHWYLAHGSTTLAWYLFHWVTKVWHIWYSWWLKTSYELRLICNWWILNDDLPGRSLHPATQTVVNQVLWAICNQSFVLSGPIVNLKNK